MRKITRAAFGLGLLAFATLPARADGPQPATLTALRGLAQVTALPNSDAGRAALGANLSITGGIQNGTIRLPTLRPFPEQQQQALRDAFITYRNLADLADGLGTTLDAAYEARAHYLDNSHFTAVSRTVSDVIGYAQIVTSTDSGTGKFFFANGTLDGKTPAPPEAAAILQDVKGAPDTFGRTYGLPAGAPGGDRFGDPRPFQTEPLTLPIAGPDYLNTPATNMLYLRGPMQNLADSPSYPSGHTTYGYTGALLLGVLVPDRYPEMVARGAEYGDDRILLGAHYTMDVIAGRTLAAYDLAHLLDNDPAYMNRPTGKSETVGDFRAALEAARADLTKALEAGCGDALAKCAGQDIGRFRNRAADEAFYAATQTYGLPVVHPDTAGVVEDVAKLAPEAGNLLTAAYPRLSREEADRILTETEGPGGGFLDDGSPFGVYSRLNLYQAAMRAQMLAREKP